MKRTAPYTIPYTTEYGIKCYTVSDELITCELVGEMVDGKFHQQIWSDENGNQYYLIRQQGHYAFTKKEG